ncbi:hypothetical protein [Wolbachia endosymbiont of Ctenocephalides felis wCfeJ]|uniref:hypothetical protein n=1 Tax=Wolbachia endosymbiont of Ctenocephalides felis wCfeJ TaxID=2732594 RepID=UPI0014465B66|nr:hypothetical protein [Wolbachia endosymbiont of Ctenocephalides felis wCfeJ]
MSFKWLSVNLSIFCGVILVVFFSAITVLSSLVIRVADTGTHSFFHWIPASSTGMTSFDEHKKSLIFDSV